MYHDDLFSFCSQLICLARSCNGEVDHPDMASVLWHRFVEADSFADKFEAGNTL